MVLRKQHPPRLDSSDRQLSRSSTRASISATAKPASPVSPRRLTRRRAQSSPQPRHFSSQESVYSPNLHTSPAFDLMPLEQAQRSPVGTASSDPQNPWADELVERPDQHRQDNTPPEYTPVNHHSQEVAVSDRQKGARVPSIVVAGTLRRMAANEWQPDEEVNDALEWEHVRETPVQLRSNNPFLKARQSESNPWQSDSYQDQQREPRDSQATSLLESDALSQSISLNLQTYIVLSVLKYLGEGYIPMTARLSLLDQPPSDSPWAEERPVSDMQHNEHAAQQAFNPHGLHTPSASASTPTTHSSHVLVDFDDYNKREAPQAVSTAHETQSGSGAAPPLPQRSIEKSASSGQLSEQPRAAPISEAEANRQAEQRSETYAIRHVNWMDSTGKLRQSPMLAQNENGPCPLLALVNALVLRADEDAQTPVVKALQTREQISLGLLIQALFEELITCLGPDDEFPDIEALSRFLTMLHTGMNVNPRLTLVSDIPSSFLRLLNRTRSQRTVLVVFMKRMTSDFTVPLVFH